MAAKRWEGPYLKMRRRCSPASPRTMSCCIASSRVSIPTGPTPDVRLNCTSIGAATTGSAWRNRECRQTAGSINSATGSPTCHSHSSIGRLIPYRARRAFMNPPKVIVNANPPKEWFEIVGRGLERHNTAATSIVEYYPVCFVIREVGNHVRGGIYGSLWGQWLHVGSLWVDRFLRGRGLGIQLMAAAEEYARSKGCVGSFLQT